MQLSGPDLEALCAALMDAFPNRGLLARLCRFGLDLNLNEIAVEGDLSSTTFNLVEIAHGRGMIERLISAALHTAPESPRLLEFASRINFSSLRSGSRRESSLGYERLVVGGLDHNLNVVKETITQIIERTAMTGARYIWISVAGGRGGEIREIVEQSRESMMAFVDASQNQALKAVMNDTIAIYVRILLHELDPHEKAALNQLCADIERGMPLLLPLLPVANGRRDGPPKLHLSIREYQGGIDPWLRGTIVATTNLPPRRGQRGVPDDKALEGGHYRSDQATRMVAYVGPRAPQSMEITNLFPQGYEEYWAPFGPRGQLWSGALDAVFEQAWLGSERSLFHRVVTQQQEGEAEQ